MNDRSILLSYRLHATGGTRIPSTQDRGVSVLYTHTAEVTSYSRTLQPANWMFLFLSLSRI